MRLLDSNILIYAVDPRYDWLREAVLMEAAAVSVATMNEVLGYHRLTPENDSDLRALLAEMHVFPVGLAIANEAIAIRKLKKMSLGDAFIAATAIVHEVPLVTRNVDDFKHLSGLKLINPFG